MKVWKEAEHRRVEEEARWKAEEEAKCKAEVEVERRVEADAKVHVEEVVWAQWPGDMQPMWQRKREEVMSLWAREKKAQMQSPAVDDNKEEEDHDTLGTLTEVLTAVVVEMWNMAAESCAQVERVLGTLEEIWGCLDPEEPEEGSEEEFEEEEVAEAAEEREALKG
ncbi:hypothetical protein PAXRUDRAFT_17057 [Paxillus rubicundulus Ve08.2h10]|uniref:Uncharacterized protein n=1 Tax=Paxillus rubicundulus Ve08.2h10 TaxID=930991 RepID=A0A0D0DBU8_9AGAM|nr:hypothetical protein PAXRUDRAFT_17057 [Paxillus rubicundulus Ve08.2h10]